MNSEKYMKEKIKEAISEKKRRRKNKKEKVK